MSTIAILKQIVDLLYEESKYNDINTLKIKLKAFEREIQEKNAEIAQLCTENIKMENMLKKYETDFEMLSDMTGYTQQKPEHKEQPEESKEEQNETQETEKIPETHPVENKEVKPVEAKKSRRDYMKEYQRSYRKKKREEKAMNMNL